MKKIFVATLALILSMGVSISTPVTAAEPVIPEIRLITPFFSDENSWDGQLEADGWIGQGWFPQGLTYRQGWAPVGSKVVLAYLATNSETGAPLVNQNVILRVNKGYSFSNAIVKVNGSIATNGIERGTGVDQVRVTARTDASGIAIFILEDQMTADMAGAPEPETLTERGPEYDIDSGGDPMISYYSQVMPEIMGEQTDIVDISEIHFYRPNSEPSFDMSEVSARMVSETIDETNSIRRTDLETEFTVTNNYYPVGTRVFQKHQPVNKTAAVIYKVEDASNTPIANRSVSLSVNKAYSGSTASITNGTTPVNLPTGDADGALWTVNTDAFGTAYFPFTNLDSTGSDKPATMTTPVTTVNPLYSQMYLNVTGATLLLSDIVEFHYYTVPKVAQTVKKLPSSIKVGKSATLPAKSAQGVTIKWSTTSKKNCKVVGTKVTATKAGNCVVKGTNTGNSGHLPFTVTKTMTVKK
jgi:hypothetical protein